MKNRFTAGLACIAIFCGGFTPASASAIALDFSYSFDTGKRDPLGLAYLNNVLFVADNNIIGKFDDRGNKLGEIRPLVKHVLGIDVLGNGNLVLSSQLGSRSALYEYTPDGVQLGGPLFLTQPPSKDADGVAYDPGSGLFWIADDQDEALYGFRRDGTVAKSFSTLTINRKFDEPEGLAVDTRTGNLLVVDDGGGTNTLYEITQSGQLVSSFNLRALTGFKDAEGVAIDLVLGRIFIGFNAGNHVAVFNIRDFVPPDNNGGGGGSEVPEPATVVLLAAGLLGVRRGRRVRL